MACKSSTRGQVFSGEFLLSFLMFIAALALVLNVWNTTIGEVLGTEGMRTMEELGVDAAEELVRTPGTPLQWDEWNVTSLGLANMSRVLVDLKIKAFVHYMSDNQTDLCPTAGATNYDCNLHMIGISGYDAYFNISHLNGSTVDVNGTMAFTGRPPSGAWRKITILRTAILNDEIVKVYLTVWRNATA
jgi:hypothetical protein